MYSRPVFVLCCCHVSMQCSYAMLVGRRTTVCSIYKFVGQPSSVRKGRRCVSFLCYKVKALCPAFAHDCWDDQLHSPSVAEAISATIKANCLEMKSYAPDIKKLVSPVAMRTTSQQNGSGNGSRKHLDDAFAQPDISAR